MADRTASLASTWGSWKGLGIPDERVIELNEGLSTYTEAGPLPGVPEPQRDTEARLTSAGSAVVVSSVPKTLDVLATKAGMPGATDTAAHGVWRYEGDDDYRGRDLPHVPAQWRAVEWLAGSTDTPALLRQVTLASGKILAVYRRNVTTSTTYRVESRVYDPDTDAWDSAVTVYNHGSAYSAGRDMHPEVIQLDDGKVLLYFWLELDDGNMQIRMYQSTDEGSTWTVGSRFCLPTAETYTAATPGGTAYDSFGRITVIEHKGDVLLMTSQRENNTAAGAGNLVDVFVQFASSDAGATFREIARGTSGTTSDNFNGKHHDLVVQDGHIIVVLPYAVPTGTTRLKLIRLSTPFRSYRTAPSSTVAGTPTLMTFTALGTSGHSVDDIDVCACVNDEGTIFVYMRDVGGTGEVVVRRYTAYDTADSLGQSAYSANFAPVMATGDSATHLRGLSVSWQLNRAVLLHQWDANPGDEDSSIGMLCCGGPSTATLPQYGSVFDTAAQVGAEVVWLPLDEPGDCGWTATGAGTDTLASGRLEISTSSNTRHHVQNPAGTVEEGAILWGSLAPQTASASSNEVIARIRLADGTNDYEATVRFGTTEVELWDTNALAGAGQQRGTSITIDTTDGVDFILAVKGGASGADGTAELWVRLRDTKPDREWVHYRSGTVINDTVSPNANNAIQWGHVASSTAESHWYMVAFQTDQWVGEGMVGRTHPLDLMPQPLAPVQVNLGAGQKIALEDGPALYGDSWLAAPAHRYPLSNCLPWTRRTSPRDTHRTLDDNSAVELVFDLDPGRAEQCGYLNAAIGVAVFGANWRTGSVSGSNAAGAFSSLGTINAGSGMDALRWTRQGNVVVPQAAVSIPPSSTPYLFEHECRGWHIELESGEVRKVIGNGSGRWDLGGKEPRILIDEVNGSEGLSGTQGKLFPPNFAAIIPTTGTHRALKLTIDAQATAEGYLETGTIVVFYLMVHGQRPSWGRSIDRQRQIETRYTRDRKRRCRRVAPSGRRITYAFSDWVNQQTAIANGLPDHIALATSGGPAGIASLGDTAFQLLNLPDAIDGGRSPLVYLENIEVPTTETVQIVNRQREIALVALDSDVSIDEALVDAERVGTVALQELR